MSLTEWNSRTQKVLDTLALGLEVPLAGRRCVVGQDEQGRTVLACVAQVWKDLEDQLHDLRRQTLYTLYHQIQPYRRLETIKGVGQDSAAVHASFIGSA